MSQSKTAKDSADLYKVEGFNPDDAVSYLLHSVVHSMKCQMEQGMEPHDLTAMQWQPLYMIAIGRANTAAGLARLMQVDTGAVTRMIDRLEAKGLVTRERDNQDRRIVNLTLTRTGRERADAVPAVLCTALNQHLSGFSSDELTLLKSLLQRMIDNGTEMLA
ncbi:MAG: MarR family transcriptional regulator [Burkholderiaceae bacterium]